MDNELCLPRGSGLQKDPTGDILETDRMWFVTCHVACLCCVSCNRGEGSVCHPDSGVSMTSHHPWGFQEQCRRLLPLLHLPRACRWSRCWPPRLSTQGLRPGWPISPVGLSLWGFPRLPPLNQGPSWANCEALATPPQTVLKGWEPSSQIRWGSNCCLWGQSEKVTLSARMQGPSDQLMFI